MPFTKPFNMKRMYLRIKAAKLLIKLGRLIQSSAVVVMRPDDLVEFSRRHYFKPTNVQGWSDVQMVNSGLSTQEQSLLDKSNVKKGRMLLLGVGGGREAIPLAKMGFEVTGIDFIPQMVERAKENAEKNGVKISGLVQEISKLDLPENTFDIAWLSAAMYSCVPTLKRRVNMLKKINYSLKPGSCFMLGFLWNPNEHISSKSFLIKKLIACLTLGNLNYERGDILRFNLEFIHTFSSIDELKAEIIQSGSELVDIQIIDGKEFAGAIVKKPLENG